MLKVEIFYILLGLFLGFLFIYAFRPKPKVILQYPKGNCTQPDPQEVDCAQ